MMLDTVKSDGNNLPNDQEYCNIQISVSLLVYINQELIILFREIRCTYISKSS